MTDEHTKGTILVVDDSFPNRALLYKIFSDEYHVLQAEDGVQALQALRGDAEISAVVLDLQMPQLNGFEVLRAMRDDPQLKDIPVVVDTGSEDVESQLQALDLGAVDVLVKPFNPQIALHRVRNIIIRRQIDLQETRNKLLEERLRISETDPKTGIYTKQAFCEKAGEWMHANPGDRFALLRWDIDRFKVYNDIYGVQAGDSLLAKIGQWCQVSQMLCGHWEADHFVSCMPLNSFRSYLPEQELKTFFAKLHENFDFTVRIGVYLVEDPTLDVALMCDRAFLALRSIKNNYSARIAYYDESMRASLLEEQEILSEMESALEQGQFAVFYQPQYNYAAGTLHGAEALIRWIHPTKGVISPAKFIPIFEHNGFISKVDEYVWTTVCQQQRKWLDKGIPVSPVSVNISRRDIYNPRLCEIITSLAKKYDLSPSLLRLEITESAYMENAAQLIEVVNTLRAAGFSVEMDDFGSGYSSLNTLKDVPVDMLKLDMNFLSASTEDSRGGSILTSVIRMAHWIKLPVIAEGVETKVQADYLKSVGCSHMQGYYFAKPMPMEEYQKLLIQSNLDRIGDYQFLGNVEGAESFLAASTQATLLFNSFVGGAAILEYDGVTIEALRLNDQFFTVLGTTREAYEGKQLNLLDRLDGDNKQILLSIIHKAIQTGEESDGNVRSFPLGDGMEPIWTTLRIRLLAQTENRYIFYMSVENISTRMRLMQKNEKLTQQLTGIMNSVPGGIVDLEISDQIRIIYFNDRMAAMFGYTREEFESRFSSHPSSAIHPDDLASLQALIGDIFTGKEQLLEARYRHCCANGQWRWVQLTGQVLRRRGDAVYASGILLDIDNQVRSEQTAARQAGELERQLLIIQSLYDTIPCGIMQFKAPLLEGKPCELISLNDTAWQIFGYRSRAQYTEAVHDASKLKDIHPDDLSMLEALIKKMNVGKDRKRHDCDHRIMCQDGGVLWVHSIFQKVRYPSGDEIMQVVFYDATEQKQTDLKLLSNALFSLFDEVYEFDAEKDTCFLRTANKGIRRLLSFSGFLRRLCSHCVTPEDREALQQFYTQCASGGRSIEYRYQSSDGTVRWVKSSIIHISGSTYLNCNRDITDEKHAKDIALENATLQAQINAHQKEDERNRILIESTGLIMIDYDPLEDALTLLCPDAELGVREERTHDYLKTLADNSNIVVTEREQVRKALSEALLSPGRVTLEYSSSRFGPGYRRCRAQLASIADASGKIYRIIGQISEMRSAQEEELSRRLYSLTGNSYQGLAFDEDVIENSLYTIENATNFHTAIQAVLSSIGRGFNVSRAYIIEEDGDGIHCSNTYEWCNRGITPEKENLQHYPYPDGMREKYIEMFGKDGIIVCPDVSKLNSWYRDVLEPQGIKAILQCSILEGGAFMGYIGFDECGYTRHWTGRQQATLKVIASIIAAFLFSSRSKQDGSFISVPSAHETKPEQLSERMKRIIDHIPTGVAILALDKKVYPLFVSDKACAMFGFTRKEYDARIASGQSIHYMPELSELPIENFDQLTAGQQIVIPRLLARRKDGSKLYLRVSGSIDVSADGRRLCYAVFADITKEENERRNYERQFEKSKIIMEHSGMITFEYLPTEDIMSYSILRSGHGLESEKIEQYLQNFSHRSMIPENQKSSFLHILQEICQRAESGVYDFQRDFYGSGLRWYRAHYVSLADESGAVYSVLGRLDDIDELKKEQALLRQDAQTDELTGLYNKNFAVLAIENALSRKRSDTLDAILFLDIDNFKHLNDTYGHVEADKVLSQVGAFLRSEFRECDIVARFGGDECIVYMYAIGEACIAERKAAETIQGMNAIYIEHDCPVQCSIGVALLEGAGITYENAIKCADSAMYRAKRLGKNQYHIQRCSGPSLME
ncbi:MAG: EAL domain-containing protein [Eubacteriales bacterium]|nr:EAL domain-containing protein [Eubacteriales bacterium]